MSASVHQAVYQSPQGYQQTYSDTAYRATEQYSKPQLQQQQQQQQYTHQQNRTFDYQNQSYQNHEDPETQSYQNQKSQPQRGENDRHVLYYSKHCDYSRTVCDKIGQNRLGDHFHGVCVDDAHDGIPTFVRCVPTVLTTDRQILIDDLVVQLIDQMATPPPAQTAHPAEADFPGFAATDAFSDAFAVLDTCAEFSSDDHHIFESINSTNQNMNVDMDMISTKPSGKPPRMDAKEMEMFMSKREEDTKFAKQKQANGPQMHSALPQIVMPNY